MREKPLVKTPVWVAVLVVIVLLSVALTVYFALQKDASVAEVSVDGKVVYSVDLSRVAEPYGKEIVTPYGTNVLLIRKGELRVKSADCPDELCVRQGALAAGKPLICLPHRLVVRMKKGVDVDEVAK